MSNTLKTCLNCGYRSEQTCLKTGSSWRATRRFPSKHDCDINFSGWAARPTPVPERTNWLREFIRLFTR